MPYFLFSGVIQTGLSFQIKGEEAGHILTSRRVQVGEVIHVQDLNALRYEAQVEQIKSRKLVLNPIRQLATPPEPPLKIHLRQALVKEKALDAIIQKGTELGVASIGFFQSRYSQRLPAQAEISKKTQRWQRIAVEACKQSGRTSPPDIFFEPDWVKFNQFWGETSTETIPLICLESTRETISLETAFAGGKEVVLLIGPEGGWADDDLAGLPVQRVFLGPRILRADTAAVAAISILQYLHGDLNSRGGI